MKHFSFFERMQHSANKPLREVDWVLFSVDFAWSITWSLAVYLTRSKPRYRWVHWWGKFGGRWSIGFYIPFLGAIGIERQKTMPNGDRYWIWRIGRLNYLSSYAQWKLERMQIDTFKIFGRLVWVKS